MKTLFVTIDVYPQHRERFIEESLLDARGSVNAEPGCARFDVLQDREDPNRFYFYEVYADEAAVEAHLRTPHFQRWERLTKDWFARPYSLVSGVSLYPPDGAWT